MLPAALATLALGDTAATANPTASSVAATSASVSAQARGC